MTHPDTNPVGFLQEFVQKYNLAPFPKYWELGAVGPDHSRVFNYKCAYDGYEVIGSSRQKKLAKSEAAKKMLELLKEKKYFDKHGISFDSASIKATGLDIFKSFLQGGGTDSVDIVNLPRIKNPISALQEYCQEKKLQLPQYFETSNRGEFVCECVLEKHKTYGNGLTKKTAKIQTAANMCKELNISFSGEELVEKETFRGEEESVEKESFRGEEEFESDKNPISVLQELCQKNKYSIPVYEEKASASNQFEVLCTVGKVTKKGMGLTKKGAKIEAAQNVLLGLRHGQTNDYGSTSEQSIVVRKVSGPAESGSSLEELVLDDYDDSISLSGNPQPTEDLSVIKTMESLNLDDSSVEIEPTRRIIIQGSVRLLSDFPQKISAKTLNGKENTHHHTLKTPTCESVLKWAKKTDLR